MIRVPLVLAPLLLTALANPGVCQEPSVSVAPDAAAVVGAASESPRAGDRLETTTREIAWLLRCPVCQGSSVWDSPATMAVNMKREVRALAAAGYSRDQILRYFQSSYGEFVLLSPPTHGVAMLVWLLPPVLLIAGGFIVARVTSRVVPVTAGPRPPETASVVEEWPDDDLLPGDPAG